MYGPNIRVGCNLIHDRCNRLQSMSHAISRGPEWVLFNGGAGATRFQLSMNSKTSQFSVGFSSNRSTAQHRNSKRILRWYIRLIDSQS